MSNEIELLEYLNALGKPVTTDNSISFDAIREKCRIKPTDKVPPPEIAVKMYVDENPEDYRILGTLGNFSLMIGKAKSKKSFLMGIVTATTLKNTALFQTFESSLPPDKNVILYFDTEQGKYHVLNALHRICDLAKVPNPDNLFFYGLRSIDTETRLQFIEHEIYNTENIGFVIIDGIRDLAFDINDGKEGSLLAGKLMKWSEEKHIHIVTVLHQNKGDTNARGHLGTELVNKAETVLSVEKIENSDISVVTSKDSRNREVEPFAFAIDDNGLPYKSRVPQSEKKEKFTVETIDDGELEQIFYDVFKLENFKLLSYSDFIPQLKIAVKSILKKDLGDNRLKVMITRARNEQIIEQLPENEKGKSKPYNLSEEVKKKYSLSV